ncbi:MAG TPA: chemotaxis protein CheV [Lachnoclostridium phytofermentans]|uniref:Stage 0 sporulation protein A homolog n=1 Tax=Lachnoclostridium phytofermentans TaxID=66219 RepID=A0A3D2X4A4_9FIRM|nr:chemotaxis protein [Lachnoclostridium sp.]HCL01990.1 chemotaxis protein CheV [Lachnoclostridium phytofermentans]
MENNILLESGTNELEVLEFTIGGNSYGINVAKIREILPYISPTPVPNAYPTVEGIYMPRDFIMTIIDLRRTLSLHQETEQDGKDMIIVTNFNNLHVGFHVNKVLGIHRISWGEISKPDATLNHAGMGVATGIVKLSNKLIILLDFEKIVADISPETSLKVSEMDLLNNRRRCDLPIIIAEDSHLLNQLLVDCLAKAGYTNITRTENGKEAYDLLLKYKQEGIVDKKVALLITDIEMPVMDGHHLTKLVKEDAKLSGIPVVIFSSLVNEDMRRKGESLGANAQLSKPEIGQLVAKIDELLLSE